MFNHVVFRHLDYSDDPRLEVYFSPAPQTVTTNDTFEGHPIEVELMYDKFGQLVVVGVPVKELPNLYTMGHSYDHLSDILTLFFADPQSVVEDTQWKPTRAKSVIEVGTVNLGGRHQFGAVRILRASKTIVGFSD